MRLKDPHGPFLAVHGNGSLAAIAVFRSLLPFPGLRLVVVEPDAMVEVPRQPPNYGLVSAVGPAQPAG